MRCDFSLQCDFSLMIFCCVSANMNYDGVETDFSNTNDSDIYRNDIIHILFT